MTTTVSDFLLARLHEWGITRIYGYPGDRAIHLLNGLYDAKLDHQPVVAIVGQQARAALGGSYQQEVDLVTLFKDVASEYLEMIVTPQQVRHVVDRAVRIARAQRAPTCIIVPNDVQEMPAHAPAHDRRRDSQPGTGPASRRWPSTTRCGSCYNA